MDVAVILDGAKTDGPTGFGSAASSFSASSAVLLVPADDHRTADAAEADEGAEGLVCRPHLAHLELDST